MYINIATIQGRLVDTPMFFPSIDGNPSHNRAFCRLAVNRIVGKGETEKTDYFCITAWGVRSAVLVKYGKKGKVVGFTGRLQTNSKMRPDGTYDNYFELAADYIYLGPDVKNQKTEEYKEKKDTEQPNIPTKTLEKLRQLVSSL